MSCLFFDSPNRGPDTPALTKGDLVPIAAARLPVSSPLGPQPNIDGGVVALAFYALLTLAARISLLVCA